MKPKIKTFYLYWLTGDKEEVKGIDIADAFNKCYGGGALRALDFYTENNKKEYIWDSTTRRWNLKETK